LNISIKPHNYLSISISFHLFSDKTNVQISLINSTTFINEIDYYLYRLVLTLLVVHPTKLSELNNMSQKQLPEYDLNKLKFFLSQFEELYNDIELLKKQRAILELPLDLSINLAPVDMNDEDSYLQALRDYEQSLHQGVKDPLIFGLKKIFEQTYKDFTSFLTSSFNSLLPFKTKMEEKKQLDEALSSIITEISKISQI